MILKLQYMLKYHPGDFIKQHIKAPPSVFLIQFFFLKRDQESAIFNMHPKISVLNFHMTLVHTFMSKANNVPMPDIDETVNISLP